MSKMLFSNSEQIYIEPRNLFASLRPFVDRWIYLPGNIPSEPRRLGRALLATRGVFRGRRKFLTIPSTGSRSPGIATRAIALSVARASFADARY